MSYFLILGLLLTSCQKENAPIDIINIDKDALTSLSWKITNVYVIYANGQKVELTNILPDCKSDDIHSFKNDQSYSVTEGNSSCRPTDPVIVHTSTWQLGSKKESLIIGSWERKIEYLNDATLIISESAEDGGEYFTEFTAQ